MNLELKSRRRGKEEGESKDEWIVRMIIPQKILMADEGRTGKKVVSLQEI